MATKIVTKNSSTASAVPTASDLVQGELAVNVADKRLFTEDNAGAIVELGTNPSGNVTFQDNGKAIFGAGSDLQIYHDGSNSYVKDAGGGDLIIQAYDDIKFQQSTDNADLVTINTGGNVTIHSGNLDVTGTASATNVSLPDDGVLSLGTSDELTLKHHNSGYSHLINTTGTLYVDSDSVTFRDDDGSPTNVLISQTGIAVTGDYSSTTSGTSNLRLGVNAGNSIVSGGNFNTVVGDEAGTAITTGLYSTAVGAYSLSTNATGASNTAVGYASLYANTSRDNTAVGFSAAVTNTTGVENTAIGMYALRFNTTGSQNTAVGLQALHRNTTASDNTAVGRFALEANTTGPSNVAIGINAGNANTTAANNIYIGNEAGVSSVANTTGGDGIYIGSFAHGTATDSQAPIVIGYNVAGAAGYTTLGNAASDIRAQHGVATWATVSDERYKKDIADSTTGLSFINALQPRTWNYKTLGELPETFNAYEEGSTEVFKSSQTQHGFIAQEIKAAIDADDSIKDGFKLWDDREDGSQEVAEAALIPVLVKAVQELSTQLDAALARIETLEG